MSKYRIIERKYSDGRIVYACEKKFLWFWRVMENKFNCINGLAEFRTLTEAKIFLCKDGVYVTEEKVMFKSK